MGFVEWNVFAVSFTKVEVLVRQSRGTQQGFSFKSLILPLSQSQLETIEKAEEGLVRHRLKGNTMVQIKLNSRKKIKELKFMSKNKEMRNVLEQRGLLFLNQGLKTNEVVQMRSALGRLGIGVKNISLRV